MRDGAAPPRARPHCLPPTSRHAAPPGARWRPPPISPARLVARGRGRGDPAPAAAAAAAACRLALRRSVAVCADRIADTAAGRASGGIDRRRGHRPRRGLDLDPRRPAHVANVVTV